MPTNQFKDPKDQNTTPLESVLLSGTRSRKRWVASQHRPKDLGNCRRPLLHMKNYTSATEYPHTAAASCSAGWLGVFAPNSLATSFGYHIQYLRKNWLSGEFLTSSTSIICSCDNSRLTNSGNFPEQPYLILFKLLLDCCQVERMSFP